MNKINKSTKIAYNLVNSISEKKGNLGFTYIIDALTIVLDTNYDNIRITDIYKKVADMHNATPARVERSIRTFICSHALNPNNTNIEKIYEIFNCKCEKMNNKDFIIGLRNYIVYNNI